MLVSTRRGMQVLLTTARLMGVPSNEMRDVHMSVTNLRGSAETSSNRNSFRPQSFSSLSMDAFRKY
jgi:hypothetical protein